MDHVGYTLVIGVCVNSGHQSFFDAESFVEHFGNRSKAVGCAACVRYAIGISGNGIAIDTENNCRVDIVLGWDCQNDFFGTGFDVVAIAALG